MVSECHERSAHHSSQEASRVIWLPWKQFALREVSVPQESDSVLLQLERLLQKESGLHFSTLQEPDVHSVLTRISEGYDSWQLMGGGSEPQTP
jgi:hypothetical protein